MAKKETVSLSGDADSGTPFVSTPREVALIQERRTTREDVVRVRNNRGGALEFTSSAVDADGRPVVVAVCGYGEALVPRAVVETAKMQKLLAAGALQILG